MAKQEVKITETTRTLNVTMTPKNAGGSQTSAPKGMALCHFCKTGFVPAAWYRKKKK